MNTGASHYGLIKKQPLDEALELLSDLIRTPSFSREEDRSAKILFEWFRSRGIMARRKGNNIWLCGGVHDETKPTVLLCSHHDTVRPGSSWNRDPFDPLIKDGRISGLGSNDAGGCAVSMIMAFAELREREDLPFNLLLAITAEEEIAGEGGIASILDDLGNVDLAVVGEPTGMEMAVAEKGLMVLDCSVTGESGHAARSNGKNAISLALPDLAWFEQYQFDSVSPVLGPVKMTVTQINAGTQHNVIPDTCRFVVDVRVTDAYTLEEILSIVRSHVACEVQPRSMRLCPSAIDIAHPIVRAAEDLGIASFGSPTMSDQALLSIPSVKIGPGLSERSHTADEFLLVAELAEGIRGYINLLEHYAELTT